MALEDFVTFTIDGVSSSLRVATVSGTERIGKPFRFVITFDVADAAGTWAAIDPKAALTQKGELSWTLPDGSARSVKGVVDRVEAAGRFWRVSLMSPLGVLADAVEQRVLVDQDAIAIATAVLAEHGLSVDARTVRTPSKRPQCVQAFESDLAFVTRILAEEGIVLYVLGEDDTRVVFADAPSSYDEVPGIEALRVAHSAGMVAGETVKHTHLSCRRATEKVSLRDLDFRKPMSDLTASSGDGALERAEYPGGYNDPGVGAELAKMRLEEARCGRVTLNAETTSPRLFAGGIVTLKDATRDDTNVRWLVLEVRHTIRERTAGGSEGRYEARFEAVPADEPYRPARPVPPSLAGVQTVTTTGAAGGEIHTESTVVSRRICAGTGDVPRTTRARSGCA